MSETRQKTELVGVRLTQADYMELQRLANQTGKTIAAVFRDSILAADQLRAERDEVLAHERQREDAARDHRDPENVDLWRGEPCPTCVEAVAERDALLPVVAAAIAYVDGSASLGPVVAATRAWLAERTEGTQP